MRQILTLKRLKEILADIDCDEPSPNMDEQEVVFDTVDRFDLTLLSAYLDDEGVIHIDIVSDDE